MKGPPRVFLLRAFLGFAVAVGCGEAGERSAPDEPNLPAASTPDEPTRDMADMGRPNVEASASLSFDGRVNLVFSESGLRGFV